MSLNSLSSLAVQDISDESASVHSGGVGFTWANNANGTDSSAVDYNPNDFSYQIVNSFSGSPGPGQFNDNIEAFRVNQAPSNRKYKVDFYDSPALGGYLGSFTLDSSKNDKWQALAPNLRNRVSSFKIYRTV